MISSVLPPFKAAEADYAYRLCRTLAASGHEVTVISSARPDLPAMPEVTLRASLRGWAWPQWPRLARELRRSRPHGIVLLYLGWMYGHHPMITFLPTYARWLAPGAPVVTLFYNRYGAKREQATLPRLLLHKAFKALTGDRSLIYEYGSLLSHSDRVFALSRPHESVFLTVDPRVKARLELLPSLPLIPQFGGGRSAAREWARRRYEVPSEEKMLVFFGYPYPSKGLETLFAAIRRLRDAGQPVRLWLVGGTMDPQALALESYLAGLKRLSAELGVDRAIVWTGDFDAASDEPSQLLYAADAVVLPFDNGVSVNNSSFATAARHQAAIVTCRARDTEPEFRHRENCYLCPPREPAALADAIRAVLGDPGLAAAIGRGAGELAGKVFSWEIATGRFLSALAAKPPADQPGGLNSSVK